MKYVIDRESNNSKLMYYNVKMTGLNVKPKNGITNAVIKSKNVILIDPDLRLSFIKQRVNKKMDKIIDFMLHILNDENSSDSDTGLVLDEINKLKGIIVNKYREYLTETEYKTFLTKIFMLQDEFEKNYNSKIYKSYLNNYYIQQVEASSRGR
jgi:hypothetical protein